MNVLMIVSERMAELNKEIKKVKLMACRHESDKSSLYLLSRIKMLTKTRDLNEIS